MEIILMKTPLHFSATRRFIPSSRTLKKCVYVFVCACAYMNLIRCVKMRTPPFHSAIFASTAADGKLVDNFSPESDVTSLQDPFTSRPYKTPF